MADFSREITAMYDEFSAAWKSGAAAEVAGFFTEDGTLVNPFGQRADGRAAVTGMYSEFFAGMLGGTTSSIEVTNVRAVGAEHAFADAVQTISAADGSVVLVVHLAALLRREGNAWRFVDSRPYTYATIPG